MKAPTLPIPLRTIAGISPTPPALLAAGAGPATVCLALLILLVPAFRLRAVPPIEIDPLTSGLVEVSWPQTDGIVNVSGAGFNGNIAPSRTFSPDDRFPNATSGTIRMTIDAFKLDAQNDRLYVVDTSGLSQNTSRILVYNTPGNRNGKVNPARTITAMTAPDRWSQVRSIEIVNNRLYAVDDTNVLFIVNNISGASGNVTPTQVTVQGSGVHLRSVIAFDGELYFLDENNAAILVLDEIPTGSSASVAPSRVIEGAATRLSLPSYMHISRGYLGP